MKLQARRREPRNSGPCAPKVQTFASFLALVCLSFSIVHAQSQTTQQSRRTQIGSQEVLRTAQAIRVDRAPKLDGTLDDPLWNQAPRLRTFCNAGHTKGSLQPKEQKYAFSTRGMKSISVSSASIPIPGGLSLPSYVVTSARNWMIILRSSLILHMIAGTRSASDRLSSCRDIPFWLSFGALRSGRSSPSSRLCAR